MPERDVHIAVAEMRSGLAERPLPAGTGRVVQVSTSPGGVPKLPVAAARVHAPGLDGDGHNAVGHGGPSRAVCLLAVEAIRRVAAEGHPIAPGTTGENVTTEGIELGALAYGTRLQVGPDVILELTAPANPCSTIAHNFSDGRFGRLSAKIHPLDTRVLASVVGEGTIRPGDEIRVLPAAETR